MDTQQFKCGKLLDEGSLNPIPLTVNKTACEIDYESSFGMNLTSSLGMSLYIPVQSSG